MHSLILEFVIIKKGRKVAVGEESQLKTTTPKKHSLFVELLMRLVKEKPLGVVGGIIVLVMLFTGIFADVLAPYGMNESHLMEALKPPSSTYLMGTDNLGRDLLSRIIYGARISVIVGISSALLSTSIATIVGVLCGFLGGTFDMVVQRIVDAWMCFPFLVIMISVMSLIGTGMMQVILALGIFLGISNSRVVRGATIAIKGNMYIEAAQAIGASTTRLLIRHTLPNISAPIIVMFTIGVGSMILAESTLSFLGFGIPPPFPSWGSMLSGSGRDYMFIAPWLAIWPGAALALVVYGINMLGDAVRDILDPRLRGGIGRYGGKVKTGRKLKERED
jgi:peptide/nickel transport system permease protein